jgi:hypothetical protein
MATTAPMRAKADRVGRIGGDDLAGDEPVESAVEGVRPASGCLPFSRLPDRQNQCSQ